MNQCTALYFADALSRERALTCDEVNRLSALVIRNGSRRMWTAKEDRDLAKLIRAGLTAAQIAEKSGRTPWAVRSRIRALNRKERDRG